MALLDSSRLDEFYAELTQELRFYLMVLSVEDREFENPGVILAEHEAILSAIRTGDPDCAVRKSVPTSRPTRNGSSRSSPSANDTPPGRRAGPEDDRPVPESTSRSSDSRRDRSEDINSLKANRRTRSIRILTFGS